MECTRYRESIQDLIDGTIGPIRRAELERHLEGCADCRALVADLETIRDRAGLSRSDGTAFTRLAADRRPAAAGGAARHGARAARVHAPPSGAARDRRGADPGRWRVAGDAAAAQPPGAVAPAPVTAANAPAQGNAPADTTVQDVESEFRLAEQHYQNAITKLEQAARLDQVTASGQQRRTRRRSIRRPRRCCRRTCT